MSVVSVRPTLAAAAAFLKPRVDHQKKLQKISKTRLGFWENQYGCSWDGRRQDLKAFTGVSKRQEGIHAFRKESFGDESVSFEVTDELEATLNDMSKWLVSVATAAIILCRHDSAALWAATGAVLNTVLNITLKKLLNQERPDSTVRSDPGMPSSHAQSFFYMVTLVNLSLVEWFGANTITTTLCGIFFIIGSYFSWLRVSQQLHTVTQVIAGALIGSAFSIFWFWSWYAFVLDSFTSLLGVRIVVSLGAALFCFGFIRFVIRSWSENEVVYDCNE